MLRYIIVDNSTSYTHITGFSLLIFVHKIITVDVEVHEVTKLYQKCFMS